MKQFSAKWFMIEGELKTQEQFYGWLKNHVSNHPVVKTQHGSWVELMAWEEGFQFTEWSELKRSVVAVDIPRERRVVVNFMKPLLETIDGKINFAHQVIGLPNSSERTDIDGATVSTKLLGFNDENAATDKIMDDMKSDMLRAGTGCIRWFWNPSKKVKLAKSKGEKVIGTVDGEGDVDCYSPNIFNVRPDPAAKNPEDMRYHIEIKEITRDVALAAYPDEVDPAWLKSAEETPSATKYQGQNVDIDQVDKDTPTFMLIEFIEKASVDFPHGRYIVYLDSHPIHADRNPNHGAELGYFYYYYRKTKKSFWGRGPLFYVQSTQRDLNRMVSMECEHVESWRPKLAVPLGALARANSLTKGSFEIVELSFDKGDPRPINMPELSSHVGQLRDFFMGAKDMISNVHEVSYARLPQYASRAPNALYESMLEQESIKLDPMIKRTNKTLIESARFRLMLMDQHYDKKRLVKILGPNKIASIHYFDKADLNGNFDVQLEIGVSINQSTSMQNKLVLELWDKKLFTGERDKIKILKILNLGSAEAELRSDMADSDRAQRENQAFQDGTWEKVEGKSRGVWVYIHDDHVLHMESHTNLIKSAEADGWDDDTMEAAVAHNEEHYQFWMALQQAQQAAQATPGAEVPGAETSPGPVPGTPEEEFAQEQAERSGPPPAPEPGQGAPIPTA